MINFYLNSDSFEIGSKLTGSCLWTPNNSNRQKPLKLTIGWRTEGRGEVDKQILYETEIQPFQKTHFQCKIPFSGPVSYDGHIMRIIWEIAVIRMKLLGLHDVFKTQEFRVIPQQKK